MENRLAVKGHACEPYGELLPAAGGDSREPLTAGEQSIDVEAAEPPLRELRLPRRIGVRYGWLVDWGRPARTGWKTGSGAERHGAEQGPLAPLVVVHARRAPPLTRH